MKDLIDQTLQMLITYKKGVVFEAASYSLSHGKRLRPRLTLAVMEAFSQKVEKALYPACALEMIHSYSLIHDDLPCMDDDDFRRGNPTLHKAYPESHAILTGDFLLTYAFEVLSIAPNLTDKEKNALVTILSTRAGAYGMIGGQILDIEDLPFNNRYVVELYLKKTAALMIAALEFGAILVNTPISPFQKLGKYLGLAYQLVDDLLDRDGLYLVLGQEQIQKLVEALFVKIKRIIQTLPCQKEPLEHLAKEMIFRSN